MERRSLSGGRQLHLWMRHSGRCGVEICDDDGDRFVSGWYACLVGYELWYERDGWVKI